MLQDLQIWRARLNSKVGKVRQEMDLLRDSMTTQVHGLRQELDDLQVRGLFCIHQTYALHTRLALLHITARAGSCQHVSTSITGLQQKACFSRTTISLISCTCRQSTHHTIMSFILLWTQLSKS